MAVLDKIECTSLGENTGVGSCFLDPKNFIGAFISKKPFSFTATELLDLKTTLQTRAQSATKSTRIYPVHGFEAVEDGTEDKVIETLDYGGKAVVREGDYDLKFRFIQGGICLVKSLRSFNGAGGYAMFFDKDTLLGVREGDLLKAIPMQFIWTDPWKVATGSTSAMYNIQFSFKPTYMNEQLGFVKYDFAMNEVQGLKTVILSVLDPENFPVLKIQIIDQCSGENLYDTYETEFETETLWVATDPSDGSAVVVASAVADDALSAWTITLTTPSDPVNITLAIASVLAAAGVEGYEAKTTQVADAS